MATLPGPIIKRCIEYVSTGSRGTLPGRSDIGGSLNLKMLGGLVGTLQGDDQAAARLAGELKIQVVGAPNRPPGIFGDEDGGGYAPLQAEIALCAIRHARNGGRMPHGVAGNAMAWLGNALRYLALRSVPHGDSIATIGPAARQRYPVTPVLALPLQLAINAPPRKLGLNSDSPPDAMRYQWRDAEREAAAMRRLMGIPAPELAAECGVDPLQLGALIYHPDRETILDVARGLVSFQTLRIRRYRGGDLVAWWPSYRVGGGPCAGASSVGGQLYGCLPQPVGPRDSVDSQHDANEDLEQRAWIDEQRGLLIGEFQTVAIGPPPVRERGPLRVQRQAIPIPRGEVIAEIEIDQRGVREVAAGGGGSEPATPLPPRVIVPAEPSQPGMESEVPRGGDGELVATRGQGRALLAYLDAMIAGTAGRGASGELRRRIVKAFGL